MTKLRKTWIKTVALVGAACFTLGGCAESYKDKDGNNVLSSYVTKTTANINANPSAYFDKSVVQKLPENVSQNQDISVIITMDTGSVMDSYEKANTEKTLSEYVVSGEAKQVAAQVKRSQNEMIAKLRKSGVSYTVGEKYDTVLSGFEITIKAKDFNKVSKLFGDEADLIVGEVYQPAITEVITNEVDVYDTGIFDSSAFPEYQGEGVVVAVLDTGLDYTHTAFSVENFEGDPANDAFTLANVSGKVGLTVAATHTAGLTGEDVYLNRKVPYAYDYADKDPDVLPIDNEHGTHVAGVIAGKDDTVTGVAPEAQLAIMKVFSDTQTGAKTSWILAALEDCVNLGVDVINMSLGTSCGFSREVDKVKTNEVYDKINAAGISLVCAASNDYNATMASEKNGSLGLTSNPDSGTVGAPSTYEAALSVASVDGVKTPYLLYGEEIIYFNEASTSAAETKDFVDDILNTLGEGVQSHDFEYVTIPGVGRASDYPESADFYKGKIVLVKRGQTTFEDKVRIALKEKGASGIIIYNNISGSISMSVGEGIGAVCSITQDEGEMLAKQGTGILKISRDLTAGPFMSDFSSWGPTSDLRIKPEITAHGGEILSAVPGQEYDRLSGTSMAAPNQAGATALIRQYVKYSGTFGNDLAPTEVTAIVNQLMMSTTDIISNKIGLPYAVRKQGSGLVNIRKAIETAAYITTFDEKGEVMDKTKLEYGDDKDKTGVYNVKFAINNISSGSVSYDVSSIMLTEGVSKTYTSHGDTTVTQEGYLLEGTTTEVTGVEGAGTLSGNKVAVTAGGTAIVSVKITLSDNDKRYLDDSFANGMYVEGFITLTASSGTDVNMNVPMLAFYGDWTKAPVFDEEYYDTHKDEINDGLDVEDKLMADAYATRVIGGLYTDYIATMGEYYFIQNPAATKIAASKDHIAMSNQEGEENGTISSIYSINAGLLRNAKEINISIVEDSTGNEIFTHTEYNQYKSHGIGTVYASSIDVDFAALEQNLKNNTRYTVTVTAYIDYGTKEEQNKNNVRNVFTFPLYIDFEAPIVSDVTYRTEYDRTTEETKLFADIEVYDNHYAMGLQVGQIVHSQDPEYTFGLEMFGKYMTPIYSSYNATSTVTVELTDYISQIKQSIGVGVDGTTVVENNNSFVISCYDYAMNSAMYEVRLPDEIASMYFTEEKLTLNPNETMDLTKLLKVYPVESWVQVLDFTSSDPEVAAVVNQTLIAKKGGTVTVSAVGYNKNGDQVTADIEVEVLAQDAGYTVPEVNNFMLTGYTVNKAYYHVSTEEREIGITGGKYDFDGNYSLSMFPSESVSVHYILDSYFGSDRTKVTFQTANEKVATVTPDGTIVAQEEGLTIISVNVTFDGNPTLYSGQIVISVKDPFTTNSIYLMNYRGLGGVVEIPDDRGITTIYSYAFSNYEYVNKDLAAGDIIDEEDPFYIKQMYIGEDTITKVIIPEGVTHIQAYAFAKLTALEEVVLPSTLINIGVGAFLGCENLKKINLGNVKFINQQAFNGCALREIDLSSVVAIGNYTFANNKLSYAVLPTSSQSLGTGAFMNNENMTSVEFKADKIKIGSYAFANCTKITSVEVNAAVISSYAFSGCTRLENVQLGKDVAVVGEYAFAGTKVAAFTIQDGASLTLASGGAFVMKGEELLLCAPKYSGAVETTATSIATGAFAGNTNIVSVKANNVEKVGAYAFAGCTKLASIEMSAIKTIGDYAFMNTAITQTPDLSKIDSLGSYAFAGAKIASVTVGNGGVIGKYAFADNQSLTTVVLGDNVTVLEGAFNCSVRLYSYAQTENLSNYSKYDYVIELIDGGTEVHAYYRYKFETGVLSNLTTLTIGKGAVIGDYAFAGNANLTTVTLGEGAVIGNYAFYNNGKLKTIDLSKAKSIGNYAFSGSVEFDKERVGVSVNDAVWVETYNGEYVVIGTAYTAFASALESVDLSTAEYVGEGAFANCSALKSVKFSAALSEIGKNAFENTAITVLALPDAVTVIGDNAFYGTKVETVDLSKVSSIGAYAFARTPMQEVVLKAGATIGDGAFAYCSALTTATNLKDVTSVGSYAFARTAFTSLNLENVTEVGDYAFMDSKVTEVSFGESGKLKKLGENPFYNCQIQSFAKEENVYFPEDVVIGTQPSRTYDVSETVKVIDEVLYQVVPNGLVLVTYPMSKEVSSFVVEEGTVRISAKAFAGATIEDVTLPSTLKALGDKAFYGCDKLSVVVFKGYDAPVLEEEYNEGYMLYTNLPYGGVTNGFEGLGISKYYMWNISGNTFYFGANFVNHVGKTNTNLVMVKPANGRNYDSFVFGQYFTKTVEGSNAATEDTLSVIATIDALPENITLADEAKVVAARAAYDSIPLLEQKALVTNYSKLTDAEATIEYLKSRQEQPDTPDGDETEKTPSKFVQFLKKNLVSLIIASVSILGSAAFVITTTVIRKKKDGKTEAVEEVTEEKEESEEKSEEDSQEE